jgi:hypothetical protein
VRIQCPENLRVPPEGSSTEGESGPKVRPKGVANGQRVNIPVLLCYWYLRDGVGYSSRILVTGLSIRDVERW